MPGRWVSEGLCAQQWKQKRLIPSVNHGGGGFALGQMHLWSDRRNYPPCFRAAFLKDTEDEPLPVLFDRCMLSLGRIQGPPLCDPRAELRHDDRW